MLAEQERKDESPLWRNGAGPDSILAPAFGDASSVSITLPADQGGPDIREDHYTTHPDMMDCMSNEELRERYLLAGEEG
jgi:hypothetical protein